MVVYLRAIYRSDPQLLSSGPQPARSVPADLAAATGRRGPGKRPAPGDRDWPRSRHHGDAGGSRPGCAAERFTNASRPSPSHSDCGTSRSTRFFEAHDPLAAVARHLGHSVPDSIALGGPGVGARAGRASRMIVCGLISLVQGGFANACALRLDRGRRGRSSCWPSSGIFVMPLRVVCRIPSIGRYCWPAKSSGSSVLLLQQRSPKFRESRKPRGS